MPTLKKSDKGKAIQGKAITGKTVKHTKALKGKAIKGEAIKGKAIKGGEGVGTCGARGRQSCGQPRRAPGDGAARDPS